jgi:hypothetical protein
VSRASKQATLREQAELQAEATARSAAGSAHPGPAADAPAAELEPDAPQAATIESPPAGEVESAIEEPAAKPPPVPDARDDIYARARERRAAEIAAQADDPEVRNLDLYAGVPSAPADNARPPTDGKPDNVDTPPSGEESAAGAKIRVYGEEVEVTDEQIREAGIAALQKTGAAEYRLQQAAQKERELKDYHRKLDEYKASLQKNPQSTATPPAPPATGARVTAPAVDSAKIESHSSRIATAIFTGNTDDAKAAIREALNDVAQGRTATPPSLDVDAVVEAAAAKAHELGKKERVAETEADKRERVMGTFQREFGKVYESPEAFAVAHVRFQALIADPANAGKPLEDLAREAGNVALTRYPELRAEQHRDPATPTPTPRTAAAGPPADELANRRVVKRTVVRNQPAASARMPSAPEAPAVPNNRDYVAQMRANRGLPPA